MQLLTASSEVQEPHDELTYLQKLSKKLVSGCINAAPGAKPQIQVTEHTGNSCLKFVEVSSFTRRGHIYATSHQNDSSLILNAKAKLRSFCSHICPAIKQDM